MNKKQMIFLFIRIALTGAFICGILHETKSAFLFIFCLAVFAALEIQNKINAQLKQYCFDFITAFNSIGKNFVDLSITVNEMNAQQKDNINNIKMLIINMEIMKSKIENKAEKGE